MATKTLTPAELLAEAQAEMAAASARAAEATAALEADAAIAAGLAHEAHLAKSRVVVERFQDVEEIIARMGVEAARARDTATEALDLPNILQHEANYHASRIASTVWQNTYNAAATALGMTFTEKGGRRDVPSTLFGTVSGPNTYYEEGAIMRAVRDNANRRADDLLDAALAEAGIDFTSHEVL